MKVFLSWSGVQSHALANVFRQWLPGVIQAIKPYYSATDVNKGARWVAELTKALEESKAGLIFLTPDNLTAPWIMFEAGALTRSLDKSVVCPLLFKVEPSDLSGPLSQFQASKFEKADIRRVVRTLNSALAEAALPTEVLELEKVYDMWWPQLEQNVIRLLKEQAPAPSQPVRTDRELLEEVLELSRALQESRGNGKPNAAQINRLLQAYDGIMEDADAKGVIAPIYTALERLRDALIAVVRSVGGARAVRLEERVGLASRVLDAMDQRHRFQLDGESGSFGADD